ncbi:MAG TPA: hypothetical protein VG317_03300, partial [Pseudonocardiaceae bacterium]|nr:hypothetical protein [Pseudonocardiaceae bacterium]
GYASMLAAGSRCREAVAEAAGALRVGLALSRPKPRARRKPAATKSDAAKSAATKPDAAKSAATKSAARKRTPTKEA